MCGLEQGVGKACSKLNYNKIFDVAWNEKVPWCFEKIVQDNLKDGNLYNLIDDKRTLLRNKISNKVKFERTTSLEIIEKIVEAEPNTLFIKGIAVKPYYPQPEQRFIADIDIILPNIEASNKVLTILAKEGYDMSTYLLNFRTVAKMVECQLKNKNKISVGIHIGGYPITAGDYLDLRLWENTLEIEIGGKFFKTPSLENMILIMCSHIYRHGVIRIKDQLDLMYIIKNRNKTLDWGYVVENALNNKITPVLYSLLSVLMEIQEIRPLISKDILQKLKVDIYGNKVAYRLYKKEKRVDELGKFLASIFT